MSVGCVMQAVRLASLNGYLRRLYPIATLHLRFRGKLVWLMTGQASPGTALCRPRAVLLSWANFSVSEGLSPVYLEEGAHFFRIRQ
jgi:hypothetical protein